MSAFDLAIIALGSNVGDSPGILRRAIERLAEISVKPLVKSSLWQTTPVDCPPGSPPFVNAVVALTPSSDETPESLLARLLALEKEFGRRPKQVLNEPRRLDLDLIAFGSETRLSPTLTLPHPRATERRFVLQPLSEIAPDLILPNQTRSVVQLLSQLASSEKLVRLA
ncbi:MAG TPA: 2-amino-4-hydroxy-6-hydroxymethyldihydropteridine diphosphokinase [Verrucomicrobiae bacterium]|nr:2-amino-4-hydroxy-6-hydroxymethyldihydropteridine diphosphokinase [Verrucomicrobiae bacterium]